MIIGIEGLKFSGKDTIADYLKNNYSFEKRAFADPLKEATQILFNFTSEEMELRDKISEKWGVSPRTILKDLGTYYLQNRLSEIIPDLGNNHAVKRLFLEPIKKDLVISDVRFIHEVDEIKKRGGILIQIKIDENTRQQRMLKRYLDINLNIDINDNHISEKIDHLQYDYLIDNNGSLEDLICQIDNLMLTIATS